jgi:predicted metal-dependent hydrolase
MYPTALLDYLVHFHTDRDYFECHEILEDYWKSLPSEGKNSTWVGMIQIAVALYHQRRGNFAGAKKMLASAIQILSENADGLAALGLSRDELLHRLQERLEAIEKNQAYHSLDLPIADPALLERCQQFSAERGLVYGSPSNLEDSSICNKHLKRDRSDVIAKRAEELKRKTEERLKKPTS